jgi:mannose-6-phosphate isomerase-like protein (cupin superfamily)
VHNHQVISALASRAFIVFEEEPMPRTQLPILAVAITLCSAPAFAQSPKAATYITDEEVKKVLVQPGTDHTIKVVDIGSENLAVGIIHRGPTGGAAAGGGGGAAAAAAGRGAAPAGGGAAPAGRGAAASAPPCGEQTSTPPAGAAAGGLTHDSQTEGYVIVSGGGTMITGGHIVNGRKSLPDSDVTKVLNGPSCSGMIAGADVVRRVVKAGDVIIIPAGVPHGWTDITDHVDYLSIRPSDHTLEAGYVNPAIK